MKSKVGGLTTHWGGWPPTEEVEGGATTPGAPLGCCSHPRPLLFYFRGFFFFLNEFEKKMRFFVILI
jgi:hypothetical protein